MLPVCYYLRYCQSVTYLNHPHLLNRGRRFGHGRRAKPKATRSVTTYQQSPDGNQSATPHLSSLQFPFLPYKLWPNTYGAIINSSQSHAAGRVIESWAASPGQQAAKLTVEKIDILSSTSAFDPKVSYHTIDDRSTMIELTLRYHTLLKSEGRP